MATEELLQMEKSPENCIYTTNGGIGLPHAGGGTRFPHSSGSGKERVKRKEEKKKKKGNPGEVSEPKRMTQDFLCLLSRKYN